MALVKSLFVEQKEIQNFGSLIKCEDRVDLSVTGVEFTRYRYTPTTDGPICRVEITNSRSEGQVTRERGYGSNHSGKTRDEQYGRGELKGCVELGPGSGEDR